jgi:gas vesicle protein
MEELMPGKKFRLVGFLIGFATGSVMSLLYTPQSGTQFRTNLRRDFPGFLKKAEGIKETLIGKAKSIASDISGRSEKFVKTTKDVAEGKYTGTVETVEKELHNLKHAVDAAVNKYEENSFFSKSTTNRQVDDLFIDFEDEVLPKFVSFKKRPK